MIPHVAEVDVAAVEQRALHLDTGEASYQRDLEWIGANRETVWRLLNEDDGKAEGLAAARASGGRSRARARQDKIDGEVLQAVRSLKTRLAPRNLVGWLLAKIGGDRAAIRASLKRLTAGGLLPDQYAEYFIMPMP